MTMGSLSVQIASSSKISLFRHGISSNFGTVLCFGSIAFLALSCDGETAQQLEPPHDLLVQVLNIADNPGNSLSALVTLQASGRGLAAIEILADRGIDQVTPYILAGRGTTILPVLGLRANRTYAMRARIISSAGGERESAAFSYHTPPLPTDLPKIRVLNSNHPSVRNVMLGITPAKSGRSYAMIIDTGGSPVWYKEFKDAVVDFQRQAKGRYTAWSSTDGSPSHFYEFDALGNVMNQYGASNGLGTDPHEFRMRGDRYALFGIQFRNIDLSALGGVPQAAVQGFVVEYHVPG